MRKRIKKMECDWLWRVLNIIEKMIKIKQKNTILMSEKNSVTLINKGLSQKYGLKWVIH